MNRFKISTALTAAEGLTMADVERCRVAIIGGGPAGSACALALARRGVRDVLLVEGGDQSRFQIGESIPPDSRPALRALGATVIWAVRPECQRLVEATVRPDRVVSIREPVPSADYIVSCMSLHQRLGVTVEAVPGAGGYLLKAA